jgi:regulator of protease activity HflC (stomatin/prohibitin superfamily)
VISDVILPIEMQRAIAKQAEAERERRSRIIVADGEFMAAQKMTEAAELYAKNPMSLRLRELQMLAEISREKNLVVVTSSTDLKELGNVAAMTRAMNEAEKTRKTG